jgi:phosphopantetheine adenylyltransferase
LSSIRITLKRHTSTSTIPFPQKTPDPILGLEIKGAGKHGIAFCSPSINKSGYPYEIIVKPSTASNTAIDDDLKPHAPITLTVDQANELVQHIDAICKKNGVEYLDKHYSKIILDSDTKIYEGTRHASMISITNRLLFKHLDKGKSEEQIKQMVQDINNTKCVNSSGMLSPLPDKEIEDILRDALDYVRKRKQSEHNGNEHYQSRKYNPYHQGGEEQEEERLAIENKLTSGDIEFVINTIKKEAQHDELSIRQLFYGMGSAFTKVPISHIVNSKESGAGKSYLLNKVSDYYPDKYVIVLSGMSAKALYHRRGVLVIRNKTTGELEPLDPIMEPLESEKDDIENKIIDEMAKESKSRDKKQIKDWKRRIRELELEIKDIQSQAVKLIRLDNQIIICLDTPEPSVYDALMSIISQDTERDQQYSFVDKSGTIGKLGTEDNILRGTPALFTSQVIDDTKTQRFSEKNRRFINVNPDTSEKKIRAANEIIGLKYGTIPEEYDELVVSRADKDRAKQIVKIMIAKLKQHTKHLGPKEDGVKIPFVKSITASIPSNHVWSMTITERTMKYLAIITKMNMDSRPRLVNEQAGHFYPISTFEDLKETFKLMQVGASGNRPYLVDWYNKKFIPIYQKLEGKPNEDTDEDTGKVIAKEKRAGLTTKQLSERIKADFGGPKLGTKELHDKYLLPLINQGIVDHIESEINKREHIYFPVEEEGGGNLFHIFDDSGSSNSSNSKDGATYHNLRLKVPDPSIFPSKTFLYSQFRILSKQSLCRDDDIEKNISGHKLVDADGITEISV